MKVYTYSEARAKLATILEEAKTEEVVIKRRKGDTYAIVPQPQRPRRSLFDVAGLRKGISREEIVDAIHESRERAQYLFDL
jgi:antitoxin Phd